MPLDRLDVVEPGVQIEAADHGPDRSYWSIGVEPFVERAPAEFALDALRHAESGCPDRASGRLARAWAFVEFAGQEGEGAHGILTFMRAYNRRQSVDV